MDDVAQKARARIEALKAEINELERFLVVLERITAPEGEAMAVGDKFELSRDLFSKGNITHQKPVDNSVSRQRRIRNKMRPNHVADLMQRIIREVGRPMTRGELVEAFERRDVQIPFADKGRYIGTIAWRHKGMFRNIEGRGYWLPEISLPEEPKSNETKETE